MSFELDMKKFREKAVNRVKATLQHTALKVDEGVVYQTPVDKGQARGGWNASLNNVDLSETENDKTGRKTIAKNQAVIRSADADDTIFISNNVGHITFLEEGSSDQAPNGMVKKTLRRFKQFVRESTDQAKRENP